MLKQMIIENFRCFEKIQISGFSRVNLIGGKNNAGKTALLEALLLQHSPNPSTIFKLKKFRQESLDFDKIMPQRAFDNLFFNQNKETYIEIKTQDFNDEQNLIKLSFGDYTVARILNLVKDHNPDQKIIDLLEKLSQEGVSQFSVLEIVGNSAYLILVSSTGFLNLALGLPYNENSVSPFISSFERMSNQELAREYDQARLNDKDTEVLKFLQIIDPSLEQVESFSIGEPTLYLKRKDKKRLPLALFGDAINRVAQIAIKLINNDEKILLIDEIENGIHYSNQREFWHNIFRLSIELDIQIFATTHSLEMIQAFKDVGLEKYPDLGDYFELTKKHKTDRIIAIYRDLDQLDYVLGHERPIRG